jgi:hypothetical protein
MNNAQPALDHTVGCPSLIAQQLATTPMHALAGLFPTSSLFCSPGSDQNGVRRAEQLLRTMDKLKFADALDWIATGRDKISPATASKMMADRIRKFLFRRLVLQLSKTQPNIPRRGFFGSALSIRVMSDYGCPWRNVAVHTQTANASRLRRQPVIPGAMETAPTNSGKTRHLAGFCNSAPDLQTPISLNAGPISRKPPATIADIPVLGDRAADRVRPPLRGGGPGRFRHFSEHFSHFGGRPQPANPGHPN